MGWLASPIPSPRSALETPFDRLRTGFDGAQGERKAPPMIPIKAPE